MKSFNIQVDEVKNQPVTDERTPLLRQEKDKKEHELAMTEQQREEDNELLSLIFENKIVNNITKYLSLTDIANLSKVSKLFQKSMKNVETIYSDSLRSSLLFTPPIDVIINMTNMDSAIMKHMLTSENEIIRNMLNNENLNLSKEDIKKFVMKKMLHIHHKDIIYFITSNKLSFDSDEIQFLIDQRILKINFNNLKELIDSKNISISSGEIKNMIEKRLLKLTRKNGVKNLSYFIASNLLSVSSSELMQWIESRLLILTLHGIKKLINLNMLKISKDDFKALVDKKLLTNASEKKLYSQEIYDEILKEISNPLPESVDEEVSNKKIEVLTENKVNEADIIISEQDKDKIKMIQAFYNECLIEVGIIKPIIGEAICFPPKYSFSNITHMMNIKDLEFITKVMSNEYKLLYSENKVNAYFYSPNNVLEFGNIGHSTLDNIRFKKDTTGTAKDCAGASTSLSGLGCVGTGISALLCAGGHAALLGYTTLGLLVCCLGSAASEQALENKIKGYDFLIDKEEDKKLMLESQAFYYSTPENKKERKLEFSSDWKIDKFISRLLKSNIGLFNDIKQKRIDEYNEERRLGMHVS